MNKREMRASVAAQLAALPPEALERDSALIARHLTASAQWALSQTVLSFLSMPHELDTSALIAAARAQGKDLAVPRIEGGDIRFVLLPPTAGELPRDRWGIPVPDPTWEPLVLSRAVRPLVITPGLAFDRQGNRLGRGKGYYDRFLSRARAEASGLTIIGVCFEIQIVSAVPHDPTDQRVQGIVTEKGLIDLPS